MSLLCVSAVGLVACERGTSVEAPDVGQRTWPAPAQSGSEVPSTGVEGLVASIDVNVDPCQDFYQYACGRWLAAHERPADKPRYGRSFDTVSENNEAILREVLESAGTAAKAGGAEPVTQILGDYFNACMDMPARDAAKLGGLQHQLDAIAGVENSEQLMHELGHLHASVWGRIGWLGMPASPAFFIINVDADYKEAPDKNMATISQAGLGLPSPDMYLPPEGPEGDALRELLASYEQHIAKILTLAGTASEQAGADAKAVVEIETALARASMSLVELRDEEKNYHKDGYAGLREQVPGLDWESYFEAAGLPETTQLNIRTPGYLQAMAELINSRDIAQLRAYMRWLVVHAVADDLDTSMMAANFELAQIVTGVEQAPPQWKRCTQGAMWALPDLVGPAFVERAFAGESKAVANDMIERINAAMEASFPKLEWMDETTRGRAKEKIAAMGRKMGYPDTWKSYAEVGISGEAHLTNVLAEKRAHAKHDAAKIEQPVDKGEWHMPAALVNAYYSPTNNEIAFPAGILQPPFFDVAQPMVMNFGGIGAVAGHELTHGFDDQGRKYDKTGQLTPWWEPQVSEAFEERVACVVAQYDSYSPLAGQTVNGELTAGENIADIGGVKEAYFAYQGWAAEQEGGDPAAVEGMSNEQVYFVAWAQNWCQHAADAEIMRRLSVDSHSPGRFRANGPLVDLPEFAEAFSCEEGTPMNPVDRCEIW